MTLRPERQIGILVVTVLVILGWLTWRAGDFRFVPQGYEIRAYFDTVDGVETNSPVTLNGLEVGRVKSIRLMDGGPARVEVTLWLETGTPLHSGAWCSVKNMGFMGEKYVALSDGPAQAPVLGPGAAVMGKAPVAIETLLDQGRAIAGNLEKITQNIEERLRVNSESIDAVVADLRETMHHVKEISADVHERFEVNNEKIDGIAAHLAAASANLEEMSLDLKENPWKLLYRPRRGRR